ncbi:hypothetical protein [Photobacterium leiognathi]|uniref:hypothetical protein n=1 Tax=Photobacterium leiognathi TaxID=553611 RepID=UPI0002088B18|nr:hypothetical protein [Photobacterium leiognathi]PSW55227.1 hypothetical protein CTM83_02465 [Photobacterium leiognathi subsp. mandapamensis]GAA06177.1 hypothetical protein PMSV_2328 [Photobacterium leiognathi subsp. mandapamensis svers.1.1.]
MLKGFLKKKSDVVELLSVAMVAAVGASLIATYLSESVDFFGEKSSLYLGLVLTSVVAIYLFKKWKPVEPVEEHIQGFFCYDPEVNFPVYVPRYRFSHNLSSYLESAFNENEELAKLWHIEPLSRVHEVFEGEIPSLKSVSLVREIVEYSVLDILSRQFLNYMHKEDNDHFKRYKHNDAEILALNNRFLNLFAKPMNERACFLDQDEGDELDGEHWIIAECNGALYQQFDFALPKNSTIKRIKDDTILIDTPRAKIKIISMFDGSNAYIAEKFSELYLGVEDFLAVSDHAFAIKVEVEFKPLSIISISDWDKYEWIDSFIKRLKEEFSQELFLKNINWEATLTMIRGISNWQKLATQKELNSSKSQQAEVDLEES